nr:class C sortase [uncultured Acetatifactor sp.]
MKERKRTKKNKKGSIANFILGILLIVGMGIMLYPTVSDWWNSMHASRAIASYEEVVQNMDEEAKQQMMEEAKQYNASLAMGIHFKLTDEEYAEYEGLLDLTGTGIMGYIQIPSIDVNLPIYHGTEEAVLQVAIGHLAGSSLPVGGEGSHCIVSGHRGLPSARLFTDLDKVREGDIFTMTVLGEVFTYQVDQIRIVLPHEVDELSIVSGMDYCTLVTCTPYGINSHRMLVRGHRIDNIDDIVIVVGAEAQRIPSYYVIPAVGIPLLFVSLVIMLAVSDRKKSRKTGEELLEEFKKDNESQ